MHEGGGRCVGSNKLVELKKKKKRMGVRDGDGMGEVGAGRSAPHDRAKGWVLLETDAKSSKAATSNSGCRTDHTGPPGDRIAELQASSGE